MSPKRDKPARRYTHRRATPEMTIKTQSQCLGCRKTLNTKAARNHLKTCIEKAEIPPGRTPKPMFLVSATAGFNDTNTVYALYTLMPNNATLRDIDELLRETWLECCGHLSSFDSGGTRFVSDGFNTGLFGYQDPSFDHRAAQAIPPDSEAEYQYDMGSTTCLTVRVQPAPEQARAWLAQHDIDPGSPVLQNLMPELCDRCGQEASHFRPEEVLCTSCLPKDSRTFVELLATTPPTCRQCDEEATRYRPSHTSCEDCRQEDHDNYRPLVNSPRDGIDCFDQRTPADQREFEENYREIGHDPRTGMSVYAPKESLERYGTARLMAQLG